MSALPKQRSLSPPKFLVGCLSILAILFLGVPALCNYCAPLPRGIEPNEIDITPLLELDLPSDEEKIDQIIDRKALEHLEGVLITEQGKPLNYDYARDFVYQPGFGPYDGGFSLSFNIHAWKATDEQSGEERAELEAYWCAGADRRDEGVLNGVSYSYCITPLKETRSHGPHFRCRYSSGRYSSFIYIQKGNLNIDILQSTSTLDSESVNQAIRQLADVFIEVSD